MNKNFPPVELCSKCKGKGFCGKPCPIIKKFSPSLPKVKKHFSGSSPPEIFVGRYGYPFVNTGILSPDEYGKTEKYSLPEIWHKENFTIPDILRNRGKMIYSRFKTNIKTKKSKFLETMQEISLANKAVSTEFFLKKAPKLDLNIAKEIPIIGNPAPLKSIRLEENPKVNKKVEYLTSDTDTKSVQAIKELYKGKIQVSYITKILSAGMLGLKFKRKLVPTRWAITATDDTISKILLDKIHTYTEISEFLLFSSEYLGNHYEFLLLPNKFAFEVIEAKMSGSVWNPTGPIWFAQDHEGFSGRKRYADSVTGAYYANRLALVEYLEKTKRQASCLVMRECRPEYYAPCGVGILREASRAAFKNKPEIFPTVEQALESAGKRMRLPTSLFKEKSQLLKEFGKQKRLTRWL